MISLYDAYEPTVHTHRWAQKLTVGRFWLLVAIPLQSYPLFHAWIPEYLRSLGINSYLLSSLIWWLLMPLGLSLLSSPYHAFSNLSNRMEWIAEHSQSGFGHVRAYGNWILQFFGLKIIGFKVFPQIRKKLFYSTFFPTFNLFRLLEKRLPANRGGSAWGVPLSLLPSTFYPLLPAAQIFFSHAPQITHDL